MKYFDENDKLQSKNFGTFTFDIEGRLITKRMSTSKLYAPACHDDRLALGADVTFHASCQTCEGVLDVRTYYIED